MKDVTNCDKPRGAVSERYIRGFPNGAIRQEESLVSGFGQNTALLIFSRMAWEGQSKKVRIL